MSLANRIVRVMEEGRLAERLVLGLAPRALRALQRPTVGNILSACCGPRWNADQMLDALLGEQWRVSAELYRAEFACITSEVKARYDHKQLPLPTEHSMDEQSLFVLYAWIRERKSKLIVETGVLNGHSTVILLHATMKNGNGAVHSIDIRSDVGRLVETKEQNNWSLHLLPPHGSRSALRNLIAHLSPIDLFFHDSQHSYDWQMIEYNAAFPCLRPDGLLGSDDADGNYAFLDFASSVNIRPEMLMDARKLVGFIVPSRARGC